MDLETFIRFEIMQTTPLVVALKYQRELEEARKKGYASQADDVLLRVVDDRVISRVVDLHKYEDTLVIETAPAFFYKQSLAESDMFKDKGEIFRDPLSVIGQACTGKDYKRPEKFLVHVRSRKTFQGDEQVSTAYAGYSNYIKFKDPVYGTLLKRPELMEPFEVALKEFGEEVKKYEGLRPPFIQNEGEGLILTDKPDMTLGMPIHYMKDYRTGEATWRNPLLSFVNYINPLYEEAYETVDNLKDLDKLCQNETDPEVRGLAWIPDNKIEALFDETDSVDRTFSVSGDITRGFKNHLRKLK
jgi:hypothetical protein